MAYRHVPDLQLTDIGDLALLAPDAYRPHHDLAIHDATAEGMAKALADQLAIRLLTPIGEWLPFPLLGSDLLSLVGEPNTPTTGARAEQMVRSALTFDGRFGSDEVTVMAMPSQDERLLFLVLVLQIEGLEEQRMLISLDLQTGSLRLEA